MKRSHQYGLAALASLCLGLGIAAISPDSTPSAAPLLDTPDRRTVMAPVASSEAPVVADSRRIAELEARLASLEEGQSREQIEKIVQVEEPAPEIDGDAWSNQLAGGFDVLVEDEPVDAEWAEGMNNRITSLMQTEEMQGVKIPEADCRTSMCRLRVEVQDREARDRFVSAFSALLETGAEGFAHIESEDDLEVMVYLSREGEPLPTQDI